jgi:prepilin-type N-terminal cleavage/methylation domain-containing protein
MAFVLLTAELRAVFSGHFQGWYGLLERIARIRFSSPAEPLPEWERLGMKANRKLRAFTLVELLVVIAIIGILVALLLPAVQAARESARRMQCTNNVKQIVLGVHNFHNSYGTVPPSVAFTKTAGFGKGWGWLTYMLPFIEQKALYDSINFNAECCCKSQVLVHNANIAGFTCPSDPKRDFFTDRNISTSSCSDGSGVLGTPAKYRARPSNYLGSFGDGFIVGDTVQYTWGASAMTKYGCGGCSQTSGGGAVGANCPQPTTGFGGGLNHRGIWDYLNSDRPIRFANISDGLSNTIMVGHNSSIAGDSDMVWFTNTGNVNGTSLPMNFNIRPSVQQQSFYCPGCSLGQPWRGRGFQSHHPTGSVFGMSDGSVAFLSESIQQRAYNALGSRAGGETN